MRTKSKRPVIQYVICITPKAKKRPVYYGVYQNCTDWLFASKYQTSRLAYDKAEHLVRSLTVSACTVHAVDPINRCIVDRDVAMASLTDGFYV